MHNLSTVIRFEVIRAIKKKTFWIMAVSFPLIIAAVFAVIYFSNKTTSDAAEQTKNQSFSIGVTDKSGTISKATIASVNARIITDKSAGVDAVSSGKLDAYFYYPATLTSGTVEVYGKDVGLFDNGRYSSVAKLLLEQSVRSKVDPATVAILNDTVSVNATTYRDGEIYNGIMQLIAPGIFLVLFYVLIAMFGNQMLNSTIEEKENRVIEMILTTIEARTLIVGKIIALVALALIQVILIILPIIVGYFLLRENLSLPSIDLSTIPLDATRILLGAGLFSTSFLLFTGILVGIGAASPTAKEASSFFGIVMTLIFAPLYAVSLFISTPDAPLVTFLSFFPLTAPIPLMLRNAVGNLSVPDALIGIGILSLTAIIVMTLAVYIFRYGTLEYSKRIGLSVLLRNRRHKKISR